MTQSAPPQSVWLVRRNPLVLYGEGNVNGPRGGRNVCDCPADRPGRRPALVAESTKPCAWATEAVAAAVASSDDRMNPKRLRRCDTNTLLSLGAVVATRRK